MTTTVINNKWVKIGGLRYKLEPLTKEQAEAEGILGDCFFQDGKIRYLESLEPSVLASVLIHEITHAIVCDRGLAKQGTAKDERLTDQFSNGLTQFLADNKTLTRKLLQMLGDIDEPGSENESKATAVEEVFPVPFGHDTSGAGTS